MNKPARKPKTPKTPTMLRAVLGRNVRELALKSYGQHSNALMQLAKHSGIGKSTIYRIVSEEVGCSIDQLQQLALALDVQAYQLLCPNLDIDNPQVISGASAAERRLYAQFASASQR